MGARISSTGFMSKDPIAAVPAWQINDVPVLLATETALPSSFSGVKYH